MENCYSSSSEIPLSSRFRKLSTLNISTPRNGLKASKSSSLCSLLDDGVTPADRSGLDDPRVDAAQAQLFAVGGVDEVHGIHAKAFNELFAAGMRYSGDFDCRRADGRVGA